MRGPVFYNQAVPNGTTEAHTRPHSHTPSQMPSFNRKNHLDVNLGMGLAGNRDRRQTNKPVQSALCWTGSNSRHHERLRCQELPRDSFHLLEGYGLIQWFLFVQVIVAEAI